ncbi:NAD(P)-dependent dehydrogenase (short-subunit alcohol dehydrogenase family) [Alkalihalobacillus xiaoxiensis]|uniref:NAD(P)-dependent dehydrogenase (Short-subunit alcohol dehydrogenase family) n=2 Tax=Shouchella xiaoxiensis TaxID=766895 RepID=A0ABS2SNV4_9BACI|nr:NAD(P)-dependent dehydrogenase (short-subunit alcohol dehydrogenase family) [Shouchella xiaoxiensis]
MKKKVVIVTGANSGLGLETAKHFAGAGDRVILAVRNMEKGMKAEKELLHLHPKADVQCAELDLSRLDSVHEFAKALSMKEDVVDILINNAGVMMPPFSMTEDGFELQMGSNHFGHFALTGLLLPLLEKGEASRVVTLTSIAYRYGAIDFNNLDGINGYKSSTFYGQSKLANLLFARELNDRLTSNQNKTISIAAHPGLSSTNLFTLGKKETPWYVKPFLKLFSQPADQGALPIIMAASDERLVGGELIGPDGAGGRKGKPTIEAPKANVFEQARMKKLWDVSEELTNITYRF